MLTDIQKPAMSIAEFCQAVGVGRTFVYLLIKQGKIRPLKVGRRTIITVQEMNSFLSRLQESQGE